MWHFYNFGDVGQNEDDRIVSGYKYEGVVVPQIQYLDNNRSVALKDNGFTLSWKPDSEGSKNSKSR